MQNDDLENTDVRTITALVSGAIVSIESRGRMPAIVWLLVSVVPVAH